MGVGLNHGEESSQNLEWGRYNTNYLPDFFHVSTFDAPDCLHYDAEKQHCCKLFTNVIRKNIVFELKNNI